MRVFLSFLVALFFLSGCSVLRQYYDPYGRPYPRNDRTVYGEGRHGDEAERIYRDVRRYVDRLDRRLYLNSRQARDIERLLEDRTYQHLRRHSRSYRRDYPFPRSRNRARGFWRDTDRAIERRLDRYQRTEYRYMTGRTNQRQYRYRNGADARRGGSIRNHGNARDNDGDRGRVRVQERQREQAEKRSERARERAHERAEERRERAEERRERDRERAEEGRERERERRERTVNRVRRVLGID